MALQALSLAPRPPPSGVCLHPHTGPDSPARRSITLSPQRGQQRPATGASISALALGLALGGGAAGRDQQQQHAAVPIAPSAFTASGGGGGDARDLAQER